MSTLESLIMDLIPWVVIFGAFYGLWGVSIHNAKMKRLKAKQAKGASKWKQSKVVVIVSGGIVQSVLGPEGLQVEVIDFDNAETKAETESMESVELEARKNLSHCIDKLNQI